MWFFWQNLIDKKGARESMLHVFLQVEILTII